MDHLQRHSGNLKRRTRHELVTLLAVNGILALWTNFAFALDVERVVWGFDGKVVAYRFNLLSVEVANNSPEAFEGVLELRKSVLGGPRKGASVIEQVYVAPFTRKWVQFYPYTMQDSEEWKLVLRPGRRKEKSFKLNAPAMSQPARVIIAAEDNPFAASGGGLKRFPENIFPPLVSATDGLAAVVLDHVPRWQGIQAQAFVDWLRGGGKVHVCFNADGTFPQFPETLAVLNSADEKKRVGSGLVLRHPRRLNEFDGKFVRREILNRSDLEQNARNKMAGRNPAARDNSDEGWTVPDEYFNNLRQMTRPEHNWTAIHLLSLAYILLIFPGCYLLGRRRVDYRITYSVILGLVLIFSFWFRSIGRRGYGESTAVNTVAIARPLDGDYYDVTQWTNAFVIDGGDYRVAHAGTGRLYSTAQLYETVDGVIDNGVNGTFDVDIPPYSNRSFTHRMKLKAKRIRLNVEAWEAGRTLKKLVLTTDGSFPKTSRQIYALFRDKLYHVTNEDGRLTLNANPQPLRDVLQLDNDEQFGFFRSQQYEGESPEQLFGRLHHPLIAASLGVSNEAMLSRFALPGDRVRVFVYAAATDEFFATGNRFGKQAGYVLYCIDVFNPEKK